MAVITENEARQYFRKIFGCAVVAKGNAVKKSFDGSWYLNLHSQAFEIDSKKMLQIVEESENAGYLVKMIFMKTTGFALRILKKQEV
jgi:hypothetical protein